jgi:hypothetical protein
MDEPIACMGEKRNECKILIGKCERKRTLGRTRHRLEGNIKMDFNIMSPGVFKCLNVILPVDIKGVQKNILSVFTTRGNFPQHIRGKYLKIQTQYSSNFFSFAREANMEASFTIHFTYT